MGTQRARAVGMGVIFLAIAALVVWLATKMARTEEGDYRLLVIGLAIVAVALLVALPAGIKRLKK